MIEVRRFWDVIAGIFILILVYLVLVHGPAVNAILKTISENTVKAIAVLQGRQVT